VQISACATVLNAMDKATAAIKACADAKDTRLSLAGFGVTDLPDAIWDQAQLTELNLSGNAFKQLPAGIGKLTKLVKLEAVGCTHFDSLRQEIGSLKDLAELILVDCAFTGIPAALSELKGLKRFTFAKQKFSTFDTGPLIGLGNLRYVNLANAPIPNLPFDFDRLQQIEELDLTRCAFPSVPTAVLNMPNLKFLSLAHTPIMEFPFGINKLTKLESLNLDGTIIKALPNDIGQCTKLTKLSVAGNTALTELPVALCQCPLQACELKGCTALKLPGELKADQFDAAADAKTIASLRSALKKVALEAGFVKIIVHSGTDLVAADTNGKSDPYVVVEFAGQKFKTPKIPKTLNPVWDASFQLPKGSAPVDVSFNVWDHDQVGSDDFLGKAELQVELATLPQRHTLKLESRQGKKDKVSGHITVIVTI